MKKFDYNYLIHPPKKDVDIILGQNKDLRANHRDAGNKGITKDKSMRFLGRIPIYFTTHPEYRKYFEPDADPHERRKAVYAILRKFPEFMAVDKL